jgi:signal transduction histidine kinase/ActR/RegA family two-component response regulator
MALLLTELELDRIFPAHAVLDANGRIGRVGPALRRRLHADVVGSEFLSVVEIERPKSILSFEALRATQSRLILAMPVAGNLRLKGIVVNSGDQTFLLLSPAIDHHRVGEPSSLRFDDFSEMDSSLDAILVAELQRNSLVEAEALISQLNVARAAAESADRAKTKFLADVSHEIRNPLNGILGMSEVMARTASVPQSIKTNIDVIRSAGRTLEALLRDLLDLASADAGKLRISYAPFDVLVEILAAIGLSQQQAKAKGLDFTLEYATDNLSWAMGDATRFRQIISNLAGNAVKFTQSGRVTVSAVQADGCVVIEVFDTGPGITDEARGEIFSRFRQADDRVAERFGGSGLGLAICRELATAMGGDISVESVLGCGARFRLQLPIERVSGPAVHGISPPVSDRRGDAHRVTTILIVDDQDHNREVARQMLLGLSDRIGLAVSGEGAVQAWQEADFDLILMDLRMPGIGGLEATRRIRELESEQGRRRTPIIILSADASEADRQRSLDAGADDHCAKPIRPDELVKKALRYLAKVDRE